MGLDLYLIRRHRYHTEDVMYWRKQWWVVEYFRKFGKTLDDESGFPLTLKEIEEFAKDCRRVAERPARRREILGIDPKELSPSETVSLLTDTLTAIDGLEEGDYALYASY